MKTVRAILLAAAVVALVALGLPASGNAAAAAACAVTTLPNPSGATAGVTAMSGNTTFYGSVTPRTDARQGVTWRGGSITDTLTYSPVDANDSGMVIGYRRDLATGKSEPVAQRPGQQPVDVAGEQTSAYDINAAGAFVGHGTAGAWPNYFSLALYWDASAWTASVLESSTVSPVTAYAIDDGDLVVGLTDRDGNGTANVGVWRGETSTLPRDLGPAAGVDPRDIDDGTVLANRDRNGVRDMALIDVASGAVTAVPGSTDYRGTALKNGTVLASKASQYSLFRGSTRIDLTPPAGSTITAAGALSTDGTTVGGQTKTSAGALVPTVWRCG